VYDCTNPSTCKASKATLGNRAAADCTRKEDMRLRASPLQPPKLNLAIPFETGSV